MIWRWELRSFSRIIISKYRGEDRRRIGSSPVRKEHEGKLGKIFKIFKSYNKNTK
jgi:hypothetical protein